MFDGAQRSSFRMRRLVVTAAAGQANAPVIVDGSRDNSGEPASAFGSESGGHGAEARVTAEGGRGITVGSNPEDRAPSDDCDNISGPLTIGRGMAVESNTGDRASSDDCDNLSPSLKSDNLANVKGVTATAATLPTLMVGDKNCISLALCDGRSRGGDSDHSSSEGDGGTSRVTSKLGTVIVVGDCWGCGDGERPGTALCQRCAILARTKESSRAHAFVLVDMRVVQLVLAFPHRERHSVLGGPDCADAGGGLAVLRKERVSPVTRVLPSRNAAS